MAIEKPNAAARSKPAGKAAARKATAKQGAARSAAGKVRAAKAASLRAVKPKPVVVAASAADPVASEAVGPEVAGNGAAKGGTLRKKDLVERVVTASGAKKKDVRGIVEAVLAVLGDALHAGEILALPPFGKARVNRQKDTAGGETLVVKLRRGKAPASAKETLAETAE